MGAMVKRSGGSQGHIGLWREGVGAGEGGGKEEEGEKEVEGSEGN